MEEKKSYYAVLNGRECGIFETWEECKKQVIGFKGAVFKKFSNKEQACEYIHEGKKNNDEQKDKKPQEDNDMAIAYVDGSYKAKSKEFSCGVVIFYKNKIYEMSKKFNDEDMCSMRNVAGEIKGAESAINFCLSKGISKLKIYYDYEGIARWAKGEWKCNKEGTKNYSEFYKKAKTKIDISFVKVKAHSGNKYNDRADMLAKKALNISC